MAKKAVNKQRYNFLIDKKVYDEFSSLCNEFGLVRSKKVELFMKEFVEQNK
ncbi:MAG: hypothetical protein ACMXYG_01185 [Candidatus Woesearchaeota archaeon]